MDLGSRHWFGSEVHFAEVGRSGNRNIGPESGHVVVLIGRERIVELHGRQAMMVKRSLDLRAFGSCIESLAIELKQLRRRIGSAEGGQPAEQGRRKSSSSLIEALVRPIRRNGVQEVEQKILAQSPAEQGRKANDQAPGEVPAAEFLERPAVLPIGRCHVEPRTGLVGAGIGVSENGD
jgi:hypothetical protein